MNRWRTDLDRLVAATAVLRAAEHFCGKIRTKVTEQALRRYTTKGQIRWRSPSGGLISIVQPAAYTEITSRDALVGWLKRNGHGDLVNQRVRVTNERALAKAYALAVAEPQSAALARTLLLSAVEVVEEPVTDVYEQLARRVEVHEVGTQVNGHNPGIRKVLTRDGELIPGLRRITPAPSSIQVRPSAALRCLAEQHLDPTSLQSEGVRATAQPVAP
jgi:hypothetical protein